MNKYDTFTLAKDLNPIIKKGMKGVILEFYNENDIEVEFVDKNGANYEYNEKLAFTINMNYIK